MLPALWMGFAVICGICFETGCFGKPVQEAHDNQARGHPLDHSDFLHNNAMYNVRSLDRLSGGEVLRHLLKTRALDKLGGGEVLRAIDPFTDGIAVRTLDKIAGGGILRSLDQMTGAELIRSLDRLSGGMVLRSLDRKPGSEVLRALERERAIDNGLLFRPAGFEAKRGRGLDTLGGVALGEAKRLDSLRGMAFGDARKRNFDEIDNVGFDRFTRRDLADVEGFTKRNFDEIDRAGFGGLAKRHFDEIDRAGFEGFVKKSANEEKA